MDRVNFTFSDLVAGYVKSFDATTDSYVVETPGGNEVSISIGANCYAELVRNLGEGWQDAGDMRAALQPGRFVFSYGIFYPEDTLKFEAKHLIFLGRNAEEWRFEAQDWWVKQVRQICDFYLNAQFPDGHIDFSQYRTQLTVEGTKVGNALRQETDTISRMVYGFATAYLLTGEDKYLEGAEKGTEYLREHLRFIDHKEDIVYWYHAVDVKGGHERKIFASEFGDDYDGIPAYEQIYALAGPTQTYRITGDAAIRSDIEMTLNLFQKYFRDPEKGGYFSHIHPVTFDPRDESLGQNRAKKNWNSVGDHAPAYLINLVLASGSEKHAEMLIDTGDTITKYFQDYDNAPFVQEKFHEDWSHDKTWGWQQNRGVVGHNLKIAWNLMRIHSLAPKPEYVEFAKKIAEIMPGIGGDMQRCGWYDVMERELSEGQQFHRYAWHDRKAWWQQEQGILAYLILDGILDEPQYKKLARESVAFYNSFFLDHDSNGVYFNVLATGIPYLMGTERLKGSHSMSGYHSTELCYLSAVYSNLLVTKQPLDLHFKPKPGAFGDNVLRVSPDILPPGSIKIEEVWIDGARWTDFDSEKLTVNLPKSDIDLRVRVRVAPAVLADTFTADAECEGDTATLTLFGELDRASLGELQHELAKITAAQPKKVVVDVTDLKSISSEGMRAMVFAKQKLDIEVDVIVVGATGEVRQAFDDDELADRVTFADALTAKA